MPKTDISTRKTNVNLDNSDTMGTESKPSDSNPFKEDSEKVRKMNSSLPISEHRQDKISIDSILECNNNNVCLETQRSARK
jgi:hypothetical protein